MTPSLFSQPNLTGLIDGWMEILSGKKESFTEYWLDVIHIVALELNPRLVLERKAFLSSTAVYGKSCTTNERLGTASAIAILM